MYGRQKTIRCNTFHNYVTPFTLSKRCKTNAIVYTQNNYILSMVTCTLCSRGIEDMRLICDKCAVTYRQCVYCLEDTVDSNVIACRKCSKDRAKFNSK